MTEIDRTELLLASNPLAEFLTQDWLAGLGSLDSFDLFWYNNAGAAGTQLYPTGLSKYFDLYSWPGWFAYFFAWLWIQFCFWFSPFTLFVPLNIWLGMINGKTWDGIWKVFIPPWFAWLFGVTIEDGWI